MRTHRKQVESSRSEIVTVQLLTETEEIVMINENKRDQSIKLLIAFKDSNGAVICQESISLENENYSLLMSAAPEFAPGKPENEYRETDIWYVIDQMRVGN